MSDINKYHKNIYEDYLAHSHTWKRHIGRVEDVSDIINTFVYDLKEKHTGVIVTAFYIPQDIGYVRITIDRHGPYFTTIDWIEEDLPLEQLLQQARTVPNYIETFITAYINDY